MDVAGTARPNASEVSMLRSSAALTILGALALAACATEAPTSKELTERDIDQFAIYHGSTVDQPHHDATVSMHVLYGGGWVSGSVCTGTLIFDRWILTAAHCTEGLRASDLVVQFGEDANQLNLAHLHTVDAVIEHPQYNSWTIENDIALLELSTAPTYADPVMPLPSSIGLTSADEGDTVDLAGFGFQHNGAYGELMHIEVAIDDVRSTEVEYDQGNGGNGTGGACNGDSGGPAFFERGGHTYVAGVTSYGDQNCTNFGVSTKVDAFEAFIEANTGELVEDQSGGGTPVTSTSFEVTGTLTTGAAEGWQYITLDAGEHELVLSGEAGTDFDLYFLHWNGSRWSVKRSSTSPDSEESLTLNVPIAGTFMAGVRSYSGSGDYTLTVTHPE